MSDLDGNPEDRFSCAAAHLYLLEIISHNTLLKYFNVQIVFPIQVMEQTLGFLPGIDYIVKHLNYKLLCPQKCNQNVGSRASMFGLSVWHCLQYYHF